MIKEGPMKSHIERSKEGVIKAEYTTYTVKDGMLVKDTTIRQFQKNGDYHDAYYNEPLVQVKE
jgi:hypothetical protein